MKNNHILSNKQSAFIEYLLALAQDGKDNIPPIKQIGQELGLSTPCVREQMELARNLGIIKVQPRKGISLLPYDFSPAVVKSLYFAIKSDRDYYYQYSVLRNQLEKSFFVESVKMLDNSDIFTINSIVQRAVDKLNSNQIQIPHQEHRSFHLQIYCKLENVFVKGLLKSYWDMYELVGLDLFTDLSYLEKVWDYHGRIIIMIESGEYKKAYQLLEEHINLIYKREDSNLKEIR
jgi:DNA-binding FadR family transcriptional regulator